MGLPLLHQNEILFAQPVGSAALDGFMRSLPSDSPAALEHLAHVDREIEEIVSLGERLVADRRQAQHRLSISFDAFLAASADFLQLLEARNDLLDHIERMERHIVEADGNIASLVRMQEDAAVLARRQPRVQARYARQYSDLLSIDRKVQKQLNTYARFVKTQLLPKLDARLRELKPTGRSFGEAVTDLISRYPVVSEYLAR